MTTVVRSDTFAGMEKVRVAISADLGEGVHVFTACV